MAHKVISKRSFLSFQKLIHAETNRLRTCIHNTHCPYWCDQQSDVIRTCNLRAPFWPKTHQEVLLKLPDFPGKEVLCESEKMGKLGILDIFFRNYTKFKFRMNFFIEYPMSTWWRCFLRTINFYLVLIQYDGSLFKVKFPKTFSNSPDAKQTHLLLLI